MTEHLRVAVLISGSGTNLQAIIDEIHLGTSPAEVVAVLSNKPAYGLERARLANIPTRQVSAKPGQSREDYDGELDRVVAEFKPDLLVLAGFMRILSASFVNRYDGQLLNIHPSLLPLYKGLDTHARALADGQTEHGATVHFVTPELDSGPRLIQGVVDVKQTDDVDSLSARVHVIEHKIYPMAVDWLASGRIRYADGDIYLDGELLEEPRRVHCKENHG